MLPGTERVSGEGLLKHRSGSPGLQMRRGAWIVHSLCVGIPLTEHRPSRAASCGSRSSARGFRLSAVWREFKEGVWGQRNCRTRTRSPNETCPGQRQKRALPDSMSVEPRRAACGCNLGLRRCTACQCLQLRLQQGLHIDCDVDLGADNHASLFQLAVPAHLEVMAVQACLPYEAQPGDRTGVARGCPVGRAPLAEIMQVERDLPADAADGQVALNLVVRGPHAVAACTPEGDGGMMGDVDEVGAAEVFVALGLARL